MARDKSGQSDDALLKEIRAFGLNAYFVPPNTYALDQLDPHRIVQVRDDPEDKSRAKAYAQAMKSGAKLGPILVTVIITV